MTINMELGINLFVLCSKIDIKWTKWNPQVWSLCIIKSIHMIICNSSVMVKSGFSISFSNFYLLNNQVGYVEAIYTCMHSRNHRSILTWKITLGMPLKWVSGEAKLKFCVLLLILNTNCQHTNISQASLRSIYWNDTLLVTLTYVTYMWQKVLYNHFRNG